MLGNLQASLNKHSTTLDSKAKGSRVNKLLAETSVAWSKGNEALWLVEQLVNHRPGSWVTRLKLELRDMVQRMRDLEETLDKAYKCVVELSSYFSNLPTALGGQALHWSHNHKQSSSLSRRPMHSCLLLSVRS